MHPLYRLADRIAQLKRQRLERLQAVLLRTMSRTIFRHVARAVVICSTSKSGPAAYELSRSPSLALVLNGVKAGERFAAMALCMHDA